MKSEKSRTYRELAADFKNNRSEIAFKELYDKMSPGLRRYINNIVKDPDLAEDLLSNTMVSIYSKIEQYNPDWQITTWAYRIAYNECMGHFRSKRKQSTSSLSLFSDSGAEAASSGQMSFTLHAEEGSEITTLELREEEELNERKHQIAVQAVKSLPPKYKPYMEELLFNERSYAEIFDIMKKREKGINEQTVKNRIFRGRKILQEQLSGMKCFQEA